MNSGDERRLITICANGATYTREAPARMLLSDFLRHELGLTGTHVGCEHGVCGACTVLLNGRSIRSCLMLAVQADGEQITTVEGVAPQPGTLHPIQDALRRHHGLQCGFCTPGFITTLVELLNDNPSPTEHDVKVAISGNICRCTELRRHCRRGSRRGRCAARSLAGSSGRRGRPSAPDRKTGRTITGPPPPARRRPASAGSAPHCVRRRVARRPASASGAISAASASSRLAWMRCEPRSTRMSPPTITRAMF